MKLKITICILGMALIICSFYISHVCHQRTSLISEAITQSHVIDSLKSKLLNGYYYAEHLRNQSHVIDSLKRELLNGYYYVEYLKKINPFVIQQNEEGVNCMIKTFKPFGLKSELTNIRPSAADSNTFLCIPAGFTNRSNQIDGLFIKKGEIISSRANNKLTGACIISEDDIDIITYAEMTEERLRLVTKERKSLFQQTVLIKDSQIFPCDLFGTRENLRRALIKFEDCFVIGESHRPISIQEFQETLISIGATDAIYLDMGSWSEGWYKDVKNRIIRIGDNFNSTHRQTNWIIYVKNTQPL